MCVFVCVCVSELYLFLFFSDGDVFFPELNLIFFNFWVCEDFKLYTSTQAFYRDVSTAFCVFFRHDLCKINVFFSELNLIFIELKAPLLCLFCNF